MADDTVLAGPAADGTNGHGLQALSAGASAVLRALDAVFEGWGVTAGAESLILPPVLPVAALAKLDYFQNFPQHAFVVSALDLDRRGDGYGSELTSFGTASLRVAVLSDLHVGAPFMGTGPRLKKLPISGKRPSTGFTICSA